jgi:trimeric autotransporter adhesin
MKKLLFTALVFAGITATAQVKVGTNPTTLATNANFQVEGTTTADQLVVLKNGNVGVGTTTPSQKLEVYIPADGYITSFKSGNGVNMQTYASSTYGGEIGTSSNHDFNFLTNDNIKMTVKVAGNVGIGTTTPYAGLTVYGKRASIGRGVAQATMLSPTTELQIQTDGAQTGTLGFWQSGIHSSEIGSKASDGNLYISNTTSGGTFGLAANSMTLTPAGNVGIGITAPVLPLHVLRNSIGTNNAIIGWNSDSKWGQFMPVLGTGSYNGISSAGDSGYIFSNDGDANTNLNGFVIAPWSNVSGGIKIMENGNVGIGIPAPTSKLHVQGSPNSDIVEFTDGTIKTSEWLGTSGGNTGAWMGTKSANDLFLMTDWGAKVTIKSVSGNMGIGTTTPCEKLQVVGNIAVSGTVGACSDSRYKKDIMGLTNSLAKVNQMQGVSYNWRMDEFPKMGFNKEAHIGFIAQDLEKIYPEFVMTNSEGFKSVDYARVTPVLVEAIKELTAKVNALESQNKDLRAQAGDIENMKIQLATIAKTLKINTNETTISLTASTK